MGFHMLEPPARGQGRQAAQAGQDGGANIRGGEHKEGEEGEEGLLLGNDPPPPPPNRPNPVPLWELVTFRKRQFIAQMTLLKRRGPKLFWCLLFLILLLLLLVGCISIRSALRHSRLDPALNYVAAPPMTKQGWADHIVEAEKATNKMREKARMAGPEYKNWFLF